MGTPLTETEEKEIRRRLTETYTYYINNLLGDDKEFCSQQIAIPYVAYAKKGSKTFVNKDSDTTSIPIQFLALTLDEFKRTIARAGISMEASVVPKLFASQREDDIDLVGAFLDGCEKRFFVLSVRIVPIGYTVGHQTILVFDTEKKECIIVEPQIQLKSVTVLYSKLLVRLGKSEYTLKDSPEQCVQAVANDRNCMFWSLFLLTKYIQGDGASIDEISKKTLAENPTPEALKSVIDTFKYELYHTPGMKYEPDESELLPPITVPSPGAPVLPGGKKTKSISSKVGGSQWGIFTGNQRRRRRTRRRLHQARKSKSKSSKSARHTRKRA
jgi:hypothetical protein